MIIRINNDGSVVVVDIPPEKEDEFLALNKDTKIIFKKVDNLPESMYGCYKLSADGNIVVDEERELELLKKDLIKHLQEQVQSYILEHYPIEKQQADNHQKEYFGTALLMIHNANTTDQTQKLTVDDIYEKVGYYTNQILENNVSLQEILSKLPDTEKYYWEQLIKAGVRKAWTVRCVYVYNTYKKQVEQTNSLDELKNLQYKLQMLPFPKFPEF